MQSFLMEILIYGNVEIWVTLKDGSIEKSIEGEMLDDLEIHKYCCRRMFLGNVHLISYI